MEDKKVAIIIGAGPAGLTAAYELLKTNTKVHPIILEESNEIGGISRTVIYNNHRMDIGGHRFFSKDDRVMDWWIKFMPIQGQAAKDDIILFKDKQYEPDGPNPEADNKVMLIRERVSRIFYLRKFFDYPISLKVQTLANMGFLRTVIVGLKYIAAHLHKRKETTLEDFIINRFGTALYRMFFMNYTEKVWGVHPSKISADWGAQRIKGLSLKKIIFEAVKRLIQREKEDFKQKKSETSLIEQFLYPKLGPGQLWEVVAEEIVNMGGEIRLKEKVLSLDIVENNVTSIITEDDKGERHEYIADVCISSMPIKDLVHSIEKTRVPKNVARVAEGLPYRDFITVGILTKRLKIKNDTKNKTIGNIVPDTWIYVQDNDVKLGRLQIFNNWSPYLVKDIENTVWMGLEYFCDEGDTLWNLSDKDFISFAEDELEKIGVINKEDILDSVRVKVKKAYPAYFGTYKEFEVVREWLDKVENLYCIGRNGQHRYNNMDHSMLTAMETVRLISENKSNKDSIWTINSEKEYHEAKQSCTISGNLNSIQQSL